MHYHGSHQKIILLIPVFQGGIEFKRCLNSVKNSFNLFHSIVISINGSNPTQDLQAIDELAVSSDKVTILTTQSDLSAAQHGLWITRHLMKVFSNYDRLLILAHDDEIRPQALENWALKIPKFDSMTAWIGEYMITDDDCASGVNMHLKKSLPDLEQEQTLDIIQWLKHNDMQADKYVFTNISGISIPLIAWIDMMKFREKTGLGFGARTEYMLITHRRISGIASNLNPLVVIHQHANQQGRQVSIIDYVTDEIRYCLWLLTNTKNLKQFTWIACSRWGIKAIARNILVYFKLRIKNFKFT